MNCLRFFECKERTVNIVNRYLITFSYFFSFLSCWLYWWITVKDISLQYLVWSENHNDL